MSSISLIKDSLEQVRNVQASLKHCLDKYEAEGNKEMTELFRGLFEKSEKKEISVKSKQV